MDPALFQRIIHIYVDDRRAKLHPSTQSEPLCINPAQIVDYSTGS